MQVEVRGRDLLTGLPKTVILSSEEMRQALEEPVNQIIDAIKATLDKTPPELAADIMDRGIVLAGGGALLKGLDERLRHETQMPVHLAESPLTCVAVGSGRSLEEFDAISTAARARARAPVPAAAATRPPCWIRELDAAQATDDELLALHALEEACAPPGLPSREPELSIAYYRHASGMRRRWLADDDGVLAGSGLARNVYGPAFVYFEILVHPTRRRRGIGTALLATVCDSAREQGDPLVLRPPLGRSRCGVRRARRCA